MKKDGSVFTLENEELLIRVERHGRSSPEFMIKRRAGIFCGREIPRSGDAMLPFSFLL